MVQRTIGCAVRGRASADDCVDAAVAAVAEGDAREAAEPPRPRSSADELATVAGAAPSPGASLAQDSSLKTNKKTCQKINIRKKFYL